MTEFIFGQSKAMKKLEQSVKKVAAFDIPIFIEGETGTGKTLLASHIHHLGPGAKGVLQKLDCATIPSSLVESELFGHEKGAFTGATETKSGLFELACGGTVFLDEIENLDLVLQAKLLNVLEEKKFRRVGGKEEIEIFFNLISASNNYIDKSVQEGTFRRDLYFRLKGSRIFLPPLRERKEDILELAEHFLKLSNEKYKLDKRLAKEVKPYLLNYPWPGNIRELKFALLEAAINASGNEIYPEDFSFDYKFEFILSDSQQRRFSLANLEKRYIEMVLMSVDFKKTQAAKILEIGLNTLYRKMKDYEIGKR